jgi:multiple antibiotic resistance protein
MPNFIGTFLTIVGGLLPVVNPPATGFILFGMLPNLSIKSRNSMALAVSRNSFIILILSLSIGAYVFRFFGISLPVLRVVGGLVISAAGWKLLHKEDAPATEAQNVDAADTADVNNAFFPYSFPLTVGPGSIAIAVALGTGSPDEGLSASHIMGVGAALVCVCALVYLCIRFSHYMPKLLGTGGVQVFARLFSFILLCIGVQILWKGLSQLIVSLHAM